MIENIEKFSNRKKAYLWLIEQGLKISERKFYNDCASGCPALGSDKTLSKFEVSQYLISQKKTYRPKKSEFSSIREEADTRKAIADAEKAEIQTGQLQRELDKKWILREDADLETCAWVSLLRDSITNRINQSLPTFIHSVGGYLDRLADGRAVMDQAITDACNDISNSGEVNIDIEEIED